MTRRIRFIADDLGLDEETNAAILHCHREGALHGASLMLGQPGAPDAVRVARDVPTLLVGWHAHLCDSRPITARRWPWGSGPAAAGIALGLSAANLRFAREELRAQWEAYRATELPCAFVNMHHHLQMHPRVRPLLTEILGPEFAGWMRWGRIRCFRPSLGAWAYRGLDRLLHAPHRTSLPWEPTTSVWGLDRTFAMDAREVAEVVPGLGPGLHEFVFHPRKLEGDRDTRCLLELGREAVA